MNKYLPMTIWLAACPAEPEPELLWYRSCGDPACSDYNGPFEGIDICASQVEGDPCSPAAAQCDLQEDCNVLLVCAAEDPTQQEGGCPISVASAKRSIASLTPESHAAIAQRALSMPLTTWSYLTDPVGTPPRLGFVIDEVGPGPMIAADGGHVDLYGYTTMTLAAVQHLQAELREQRARNDELEARLVALEHKLP